MAAGNLTLGIAITATNMAGGVIQDLARSFLNVSPAMGGLIGMALSADVAIASLAVTMGVDAVQSAGDFQQQMTKLYTTAGESASNLQMVGDGILGMASQVGTSAKDLGDAMYWIESGGLHGASALEALRVAAQAARAENANLDSVSIALAASLNAYAGKGMTAIQVMNTLTAATGQGMMTFEQLSGSLASVLPAAAKFGVSLNNVTAALATMTAQGDPAAQAATHLKQLILALEAPSKIGAKSLADVGLTTQAVANEMRISLPGALQMIMDAVGKKFPEGSAAYNQAIKNIAGGSKQMMGFLELTGTHMQTFSDNVKKISGAVQAGGKNLMGWNAVQDTMNFKLSQANAAWGVFLITLGQQLLPVMTQVVGAMVPIIQGLQAVMLWVAHNQVAMAALLAVVGSLAVVISVVLVAALAILIVGLTLMTVEILLVLAPIILIILAFQHWGQIAHWLQGVWAAVIAWLMSAFSAIGAFFVALWGHIASATVAGWNHLVSGIRGIVTGAISWLTSAWQNAVNTVVGWFTWLYNHNYYFKDLVDAIRTVVTAFVGWFEAAWQRTVANVTALWDFIKGVAQRDWTIITAAISAAVSIASSIIHSVWSAIIGFLAGAWATITSAVSTAWGKISSIFSSAWGTYVAPPLNSLLGSLTSFFSNLASMAVQWGTNLIQGFINGMSSMIGNVKNVAGNIMGAVGNILGFHSPAKEGPGAELDIWGPNLVKGFTQGIISSLPMMQLAMNRLMLPLANAMHTTPQVAQSGGNAFALSGAHGGNAFALSGTTPIVVQVQPTSAEIHLDGRKVGDSISKYQGKAVRIEGGYRNA